MIRNIIAAASCVAALSSCASYAGRAQAELGVQQNAESGILRLRNMSRCNVSERDDVELLRILKSTKGKMQGSKRMLQDGIKK